MYLEILDHFAKTHGVSIWTYCLMENHVHHIVVPREENSLSRVFGSTHSQYSRIINHRYGWCGHLWQERFWSFAMRKQYAFRACRYVLMNPVRAGLVLKAEEWAHSSARQHLGLEPCRRMVDSSLLSAWVEDWDSYLSETDRSREDDAKLRHCANTGTPWFK